MKKSILLVSVCLALSVVGCKKDALPSDSETKVTETVEITLPENSSYTYNVPANQSDDPYQITQDASHASASVLETKSSGESIYTYTPVRGFVGDDQVIIENVEELHIHENQDGLSGGCYGGQGGTMQPADNHVCHHEHGHGNCGTNEQEVERKIILNIHIKGVASRMNSIHLKSAD